MAKPGYHEGYDFPFRELLIKKSCQLTQPGIDLPKSVYCLKCIPWEPPEALIQYGETRLPQYYKLRIIKIEQKSIGFRITIICSVCLILFIEMEGLPSKAPCLLSFGSTILLSIFMQFQYLFSFGFALQMHKIIWSKQSYWWSYSF